MADYFTNESIVVPTPEQWVGLEAFTSEEACMSLAEMLTEWNDLVVTSRTDEDRRLLLSSIEYYLGQLTEQGRKSMDEARQASFNEAFGYLRNIQATLAAASQ